MTAVTRRRWLGPRHAQPVNRTSRQTSMNVANPTRPKRSGAVRASRRMLAAMGAVSAQKPKIVDSAIGSRRHGSAISSQVAGSGGGCDAR